VDPGQWTQVLMNLAVNARDAMPEGGRLTIETRSVVLDESFQLMHPTVVPGPYAMLTMSDTGIGMTPEIRNRVFEPFFTTKGLGRGTGLGLAVVHGIVAQNGGHIAVYSEPNVGTSFRIYLPVAGEGAAGVEAPAPPESLDGDETILVVEDEESIRRYAARALSRRGYRVLQAGDGEAAMELVAQHAGPIHLLLTDVVMPKMDGRQLAQELSQRFPSLHVLYTSGYTDDAIVRHGILQAEVAFLSKPYVPLTLLRRVREVLDRA
jgi:two-component system, cell cycle sensor histidine kinase and response regulator CckA